MSTEKFRKLESVDEYKTIQKNMRHNITTLFSNIFFLPVDIEHYITSGRALLRELDKGFILLLEETKYYKLYIYADVEQQIVIEPFDKKIVFRYMYREEKGRAVLPHIEEQFRKNGFLKEGTLVYISGNAEELLDKSGAKKTSHTNNKVPCIIYDNTENVNKYELANVINPGLSNLAATMATLVGYTDVPSSWGKSLIKVL